MTYTDFVRSLTLTPDSECEAVGAQLKGIFGQASLYPDLGPEIAALVQEFLKNNELAKAMGFLKVNCDLYPGSPAPYVALASAYIWSGNFEPCRELLQKARGLDDTHPMVGVNHFYEFGQRLHQAGKRRELIEWATIAAELYPKEAKLYADLGDLYALGGEKEKAAAQYKKALALDPSNEAIKKKLKEIKK
jgi:tetratricopeptide (TPR) repeat protein